MAAMRKVAAIAPAAKRATIVLAAAVEVVAADVVVGPKENALAKSVQRIVVATAPSHRASDTSRVIPQARVSRAGAGAAAVPVALVARIRAAAKRRTIAWMTTAWKKLSWMMIKTTWSFLSTAKNWAVVMFRPVTRAFRRGKKRSA